MYTCADQHSYQIEDDILYSACLSSRKTACGCTSGAQVLSAVFLGSKNWIISLENVGTPSSIWFRIQHRKMKISMPDKRQ